MSTSEPPYIAQGPQTSPSEAHLSGLYCLAAAAWWLLKDDDPYPTARAVLKAMKASLPPTVARTGVIEKHLRKAADLYSLAIFRCGETRLDHRGHQDENPEVPE